MRIDLITATSSDFEPFVGQKFYIDLDEGPIELVLDNVKINKDPSVRDNHLEIGDVFYPPRQSFALTFEGPREPILVSKVYSVRNDQIGDMELFISAFRQDHDCMLYESVFN